MNWMNIASAVEFYKFKGFKYIDVPWVVPQSTISMTKPPEKVDDRTFVLENQNELVASAEQGFIQLLLENQLPEGRFVTCTPCFRGEPVYDALHKPYFMKVELYSSYASPEELDFVLRKAAEWFALHGLVTKREQINADQIDLTSKQIELGSYGYRRLDMGKTFIYGTGHAEPRVQYVKDLRTA